MSSVLALLLFIVFATVVKLTVRRVFRRHTATNDVASRSRGARR